jgi:hypothetical protein
MRARIKRDFEGVKGWFDTEDEVSFHRTVSLYCDQMIDEYQDLVDKQAERRQKDNELMEKHIRESYNEQKANMLIQRRRDDNELLTIQDKCDLEEKMEMSLWEQKKIEAELRIIFLLLNE